MGAADALARFLDSGGRRGTTALFRLNLGSASSSLGPGRHLVIAGALPVVIGARPGRPSSGTSCSTALQMGPKSTRQEGSVAVSTLLKLGLIEDLEGVRRIHTVFGELRVFLRIDFDLFR